MKILMIIAIVAIAAAFIMLDKLRDWLLELFRRSGNGGGEDTLPQYESTDSMENKIVTPLPKGKPRHPDVNGDNANKKGR